MPTSAPSINRPHISKLNAGDLQYVTYDLKQEKRIFEFDKLALFIFWLIMPAGQFLRSESVSVKVDYYFLMLAGLLPFVLLAGWVLYKNRVCTLKKAIDKNDKMVISTHIENIEVDEYNSIILHTTYQNHKVFRLGNVIGKIKINRPITISYFEGCNKVIDYVQ